MVLNLVSSTLPCIRQPRPRLSNRFRFFLPLHFSKATTRSQHVRSHAPFPSPLATPMMGLVQMKRFWKKVWSLELKRRPHAPTWDSELGQIIVSRLVFGFVTRRIWFTRAEVKQSFYKHDCDLPLLSRNMLFNRSTDLHVPNGPRARQPRGCQR